MNPTTLFAFCHLPFAICLLTFDFPKGLPFAFLVTVRIL